VRWVRKLGRGARTPGDRRPDVLGGKVRLERACLREVNEKEREQRSCTSWEKTPSSKKKGGGPVSPPNQWGEVGGLPGAIVRSTRGGRPRPHVLWKRGVILVLNKRREGPVPFNCTRERT